MNTLSVPSAVQDFTLLINIEGKWNHPDNSNSTNSLLTIPNFAQQNNGVYKFNIINWDGVEVCAIQINLTTTTTITGMFFKLLYSNIYKVYHTLLHYKPIPTSTLFLY